MTYAGGTPSATFEVDKGTKTTEEWIAAAFNTLQLSAPSDTTALTAQWCCDGDDQVCPLTRNPGETYINFFRRFKEEVEGKMADCPPEA
ncbi:hypothetical protein [Planctomycetes bacterium Pla133]